MDNKYFWIYMLLEAVDVFAICGMWVMVLTPRYKKGCVFVVSQFILLFICVIKIGVFIPWDAYTVLISQAVTLAIVIFGFKDPLPVRLFGFAIVQMISFCSEFMARIVIIAAGKPFDWDALLWKGPTLIMPMIIMDIFSVFFAVTISWIWNSNVRTRKVAGMWYYLCLPVSQLFFLCGFTEYNVNTVMKDTVIILLGLALSSCGAMLLCVLWKWQAQREELQKEYARVQSLMEQEQIYYRDLEDRIEAFARLRHEWNNYLSALYYLSENVDSQEEALGILRHLLKVCKTDESF